MPNAAHGVLTSDERPDLTTAFVVSSWAPGLLPPRALHYEEWPTRKKPLARHPALLKAG
jgi:hypothetical protein